MDTLVFFINAVQGPALLLVPKYQEVTTDTLKIALWAEEIDDLLAARLVVSYDSSYLDFSYLTIGDFWSKKGGEVICFDSSNKEEVVINLATALGQKGGITGSGVLANLYFVPLNSGETQIETSQSECILRDSKQNNIPLRQNNYSRIIIR